MARSSLRGHGIGRTLHQILEMEEWQMRQFKPLLVRFTAADRKMLLRLTKENGFATVADYLRALVVKEYGNRFEKENANG